MNLKKILKKICCKEKTNNISDFVVSEPYTIEDLELEMKKIETEHEETPNFEIKFNEDNSSLSKEKKIELYNKIRYERPYDIFEQGTDPNIILEHPNTDLYANNEIRYENFNLIIDILGNFILNKESINILDVGCGTGFLVNALEQFTNKTIINYTGIDYNTNIIDIVNNNRKNRNVFENYLNISSDRFLDLFEEKYDIIIFSNTFTFDAFERETTEEIMFYENSQEYIFNTLKKYYGLLNNNGLLYMSFIETEEKSDIIFNLDNLLLEENIKDIDYSSFTMGVIKKINLKYFYLEKNE